MPLTKTDERYLLDLMELVDASEWEEARELITFAIREERNRLVRKMVDYYQAYSCKHCLGEGTVIEGAIDNQREVRCECQLES